MRTFFLLTVFICILTSCNNKIDKKDITIIDGVQLGTSVEELYSQFDSLGVSEKIIYTKVMFSDINEVSQNKIKAYTTDIFNTSQYRSQGTEHYGIYYPTTMSGTKNVVGLNVLLIHTESALLISKYGFTNLTKETQIPGISQDISYDQADDIANMLSKKYGKPTDTLKFEYTKFYVIEGNQIRDYHSDSLNIGEMIFWETKYLKVKYFKGIRSPTGTFNAKERYYMTYFDSDPYRVINYETGERPCRSYSYISYDLTEEAIKKLGLDKLRL